ncbi:hypothetical protein PTKU46_83450 [Paraburkholderia terrae]
MSGAGNTPATYERKAARATPHWTGENRGKQRYGATIPGVRAAAVEVGTVPDGFHDRQRVT